MWLRTTFVFFLWLSSGEGLYDGEDGGALVPCEVRHYLDLEFAEVALEWRRHDGVELNEGVDDLPELEGLNGKQP